MKTKTLILTFVTAAFAASATLPALANDPKADKREKRIERMMKRVDLNGDSRISAEELSAAVQLAFAAIDTNHDGELSAEEIANQKVAIKAQNQRAMASKTDGRAEARAIRLPKAIGKHFAKLDADKNGLLSASEMTNAADRMFKHRDRNKDGYITAADFTG
jgi:Ca2+-binding EF-hand superfamily protein